MIIKEPSMLLLLVLLPILGKLLIRARRLKEESAAKLRGKKERSSGWKRNIALRLGALAALIFALAQPAWNPHPGPAAMQGRDLVIALDISRSMLAGDVFPSRLEASKIAIFEALDALRGQRLGLITFAGAASVRVPLTLDHNFVRYMLDRAQPSDADVGSTSLQSAIEKAIDIVLKESKQGQQDLLILTDGEDYLSNIETTTQELRDCGARVLIIGLGDPLAGARIPDMNATNEWMRGKNGEVISRLDEEKLTQLSAESPNVTYFAAQTRPFDLIDIYRKMLAQTQGVPGTEGGRMIYTEGYPLFIALALLLWVLPLCKRFIPIITALLLTGCSPSPSPQATDSAQHLERGRALWTEAQSFVGTDPHTALPTLLSAREEFLRAAMIAPGNISAAEQIAGVSLQIHAVEQKLQEQEKEEEDLQQKLAIAIEQLKVLTERESSLSRLSQQLLRKRPPPPAAEGIAAAHPALVEQTEIGQGTGDVLDTVTQVQAVIQRMLKMAYGEDGATPPTEFDEVIVKLSNARTEQQRATDHLEPQTVSWPQANSSLLTAAHRMQEALDLLSDQSQGDDSEQDSEEGDESEWDYEDDMEWDESDTPSDMSMPMQSGSFKSALENQSLPTPNYTADEILSEEASNMEQRAQQKSERAGAKVENNW